MFNDQRKDTVILVEYIDSKLEYIWLVQKKSRKLKNLSIIIWNKLKIQHKQIMQNVWLFSLHFNHYDCKLKCIFDYDNFLSTIWEMDSNWDETFYLYIRICSIKIKYLISWNSIQIPDRKKINWRIDLKLVLRIDKFCQNNLFLKKSR